MQTKVKKSALRVVIAISISAVILCVFPLFSFSAPNNKVLYALSTLLGYVVLSLPVFVAIKITKPNKEELGLYSNRLWQSVLCGGIFIVAAVFLAPFAIFFVFGNALIPSFGAVWLAILSGVFEEFIFRGYLQGALYAYVGRWRGVLLCALVFALFHLPARIYTSGMGIEIALLSTIPLFLAGLMYSTTTLIFKNIYAAIGLHIAANIAISTLPYAI